MILAAWMGSVRRVQAEPNGSEVIDITQTNSPQQAQVSGYMDGEADNIDISQPLAGGQLTVMTPEAPPDLNAIAIDGKVVRIAKTVWLQFSQNPPAGYLSEEQVDFLHRYAQAPFKVLSIEIEKSSSGPAATYWIIGPIEESAVMDSCEHLALEAYTTGGPFVLAADIGSGVPGALNKYIWLNPKNSDGKATLVHCSLPFKAN